MKTIAVQELRKLLPAGSPVDLIDVRTPAEYAGVHVPEARLTPLDGLDCGTVIASRKGAADEPGYILCHGGVCAGRAAARFAEAGFAGAVVVEGGTEAWVDAGFPVERSGKAILPLDRQLQLTLGSLVVAGVLRMVFADPRWAWLSGFVGLIVAGATGACPMRSLIARMPWKRTGGNCCVKYPITLNNNALVNRKKFSLSAGVI